MTTQTPTGFLPIDVVYPSTTNPRRTFDQAQLDELAASIKTHGVLQPILVRPKPQAEGEAQYYEIIAGERRYRASLQAGQTMIPAVVREMADDDVIEVQIIENLQRADVHPLEEAEGYERLMRGRGNVLGVDQVAERIGKSRGYVYARLKLLALLPQAREAFRHGKLTPSTALYLARVPADRQLQALKDLTDRFATSEGPVSARRASDMLQRGYMTVLREAPFDVKSATLVASAGACEACPKRTSAQPEMFADVGGEDRCTDLGCWDAKTKAHGQLVVAKAEQEGLRVIAGKDAKKVWSDNWRAPAGFVRADDRCYEAAGSKPKTNAQAAGDKVTPVVIVNPRTGLADRFLPEKELRAALRGPKEAGPSPETKKEKARQAEMGVRRELLTRILATDGEISLEDQRTAARALARRLLSEAARPLAKVAPWIPERHDDIVKAIDAADEPGVRRLLLALSLAGELALGPWGDVKPSAELEAAAGRHGVDPKAVRAELAAAAKAKAKPKAAPKADAFAKPKKRSRKEFYAAKNRAATESQPANAADATAWPFATAPAEQAAA